jgi:signal transduction histidine kinase
VSGDIPLARSRRPLSLSTWDGSNNLALPWELLLLGAVLGTTALSLLNEPQASLTWRLAVAGVAVALLGWYAVLGHPTLRQPPAAREYVCGVGLLALFLIALTLTPTAAYLLVGLPAIGYVLLPSRPAYGLAAAFCAAPTAVFLLRTHDVIAALRVVVPIGVASMLFSVVIATAVNRILRRSDERARLIAELESSRAEVVRLSREAGVAEERQRLAGEIHDTVAQGLSSVVMLVQAADAAIATEPRPLPTAVEVVLLRAAQEGLTNAHRHGGAGRADLRLTYGTGGVCLEISDDGCGFDVSGASQGYGLAAMRGRTEQVGGSLTIHSGPLRGTVLTLEVPA